MNTILSLVRKDLKLFSKDRSAVVLTFAVPMLLIVIFGMIFGDSGGEPTGIRLLVIDESRTESSEKLISYLRQEDTFLVKTERQAEDGSSIQMDRESARQMLENEAGTYRYALILPENLLAEDFGLNLAFLYNPQNLIEFKIVQGILQKTLFSKAFPILMDHSDYGLSEIGRDSFNTSLADIISEHFGGDAETILGEIESGNVWGMSGLGGDDQEDGSGSDDMLSGIFNLEKEQVFGKDKNPICQSVGGWAVMFMLFALSGAASSLFDERDNGLFLRILSGPASRQQILWSKFVFCALLGLVQMVVLFAFGQLIYGIFTSPAQVFPLLVISVVTACTATSFGMLLSSFAKTPAQANALGTLLILIMSAFGGAMFPVFMMPEFIRTFISPFTLVYWSMEGILAVLWRDATVWQIMPQLGVLSAIAAVILSISLWRFGRSDLFR